MKKTLCILALILAVALTGCRRQEAGPATPPEGPETPPETAPLAVEELRLEILKTDQRSEDLLAAVRVLPERLRTALAERGVEAESVRLTVGASAAASVEAVESGGVDAAFLPADLLAAQETTAAVTLVSGPADGDAVGRTALLFAAPTEYGANLAGRPAPTWEELSRARWAVTEGTAAEWGAALWLADRCEGKTLADLPDLTEYSSEADLLSAAAAGEVDLFALDTAQSAQVAAVLPEAAVLRETERLYDGAVLAGTVDVRLTEALAGAVNALLEQDGEDGQLLRAVLDAEADTRYRTAPAGALDAQRHLAALG